MQYYKRRTFCVSVYATGIYIQCSDSCYLKRLPSLKGQTLLYRPRSCVGYEV